jgi:hypothetical protein
MTFAHTTTLCLWFKTVQCIDNEDNARPYEPCADRLYKLVCDEGEQDLVPWWIGFWSVVGTKYPTIAAEHIPQFLHEIIDRKEISLIVLLSVSLN